MPCYDSRDEPSYVRADAKREFQADLDKLTRLLCEACRLIDMGWSGIPSVELRAWWTEHRKLDAKRKRHK